MGDADAAESPVTATPPDAGARPSRMRAADVIALAQLWADQFQHMTTLAVAGAGGLLVLLQVGVVATGRYWWMAFLLFASGAAVSVFGQVTVVDEATAGSPPGGTARALRMVGFMCFGGAGYAVTRLLL
jgi:hypothetical protein